MSKELKLSDMRNWTDGRHPEWNFSDAKETVCDLQAGRIYTLGQLAAHEQDILQNAPNECVQRYRGPGEGWRQTSSRRGDRFPDWAYRLHPDVTVVDDTAEDGEYECVDAKWDDVNGWHFRRGGLYPGLTQAPDHGSICTEVEDTFGEHMFVQNWIGYGGMQWGYDTVEQLMADGPRRRLCTPLKRPKNVVFRREGN